MLKIFNGQTPASFCLFSFFSNILQEKLKTSAVFELGSSEKKANMVTNWPSFVIIRSDLLHKSSVMLLPAGLNRFRD